MLIIKNYQSLFIIIAFSLIHGFKSTGQNNDIGGFQYKQYSTKDGLPTNAINGAVQDHEGYIWFYTEKGVSKFDGYEFKNFSIKDNLPFNNIKNLWLDSLGRTWIDGSHFLFNDKIHKVRGFPEEAVLRQIC